MPQQVLVCMEAAATAGHKNVVVVKSLHIEYIMGTKKLNPFMKFMAKFRLENKGKGIQVQ
jgi:hypothetical protein